MAAILPTFQICASVPHLAKHQKKPCAKCKWQKKPGWKLRATAANLFPSQCIAQPSIISLSHPYFQPPKAGKIWIERDGTEEGVAEEFIRAGGPREDIVLAFYRPERRRITEFAVA